jgi:hypothetical protein
MELVLNGLQWQICLIYLDDVIVFGSSFSEHIQRLETVLQRILDAGLKLKPEKCTILKPEVTFLGHVVSQKGIKPNLDNIAKILSWPAPKNVSEVRQILGMGSYYRRFIKDFSLMVKPLTELIKKSNEFIWSDVCQEAFKKGAGQDNILAILSGFGFIPFCETTCPRKVTSGFSIVHFSGFSFKPASFTKNPRLFGHSFRSYFVQYI